MPVGHQVYLSDGLDLAQIELGVGRHAGKGRGVLLARPASLGVAINQVRWVEGIFVIFGARQLGIDAVSVVFDLG